MPIKVLQTIAIYSKGEIVEDPPEWLIAWAENKDRKGGELICEFIEENIKADKKRKKGNWLKQRKKKGKK